MRVKPTGTLKMLLDNSGIQYPSEGVELDEVRFATMLHEVQDTLIPDVQDDDKEALAMYMALTHPGYGEARVDGTNFTVTPGRPARARLGKPFGTRETVVVPVDLPYLYILCGVNLLVSIVILVWR